MKHGTYGGIASELETSHAQKCLACASFPNQHELLQQLTRCAVYTSTALACWKERPMYPWLMRSSQVVFSSRLHTADSCEQDRCSKELSRAKSMLPPELIIALLQGQQGVHLLLRWSLFLHRCVSVVNWRSVVGTCMACVVVSSAVHIAWQHLPCTTRVPPAGA